MEKVRILHVMDKVSVDGSKIQGPARQISYRVPYYDPHRYEIMLCNLRKEDAACDILRSSGIEVVSLGRGKFDLRAYGDIMKLIDRWKPSIIHSHCYAGWNFGRLAAHARRIPSVLQEHFVDDNMPFYQKIIDRLLRKRFTTYIAITHAVRDFMVEQRFADGDAMNMIGNGVPIDKLEMATPEEIESLKAKLGIPPAARIVGTVGRLAEMKGQKYFLEAAPAILKNFPDTCFVLVGEGPLYEELKEQARSLGIADRVIFAGYQEDVFPFLALFDVSVISSVFGEGFCSVGIESFAVGTPVITTDLPCFLDVYRDDWNVLMVEARKSEALAEGVMKLLDPNGVAGKLIANGTASLAVHNSGSVANEYLKVYESLL